MAVLRLVVGGAHVLRAGITPQPIILSSLASIVRVLLAQQLLLTNAVESASGGLRDLPVT